MADEKIGGDSGVGYIEHSFVRGSNAILTDPEKLEKQYPELYARIKGLQDGGKEVWGRFSANKAKAVLTVVGAAAAAAGVAGIGYLLVRKEGKEHKK